MRNREWGYTPFDPEGRELVGQKSLTEQGAWRRLVDALRRHSDLPMDQASAERLGYTVRRTGLPIPTRWPKSRK